MLQMSHHYEPEFKKKIVYLYFEKMEDTLKILQLNKVHHMQVFLT